MSLWEAIALIGAILALVGACCIARAMDCIDTDDIFRDPPRDDVE